MIFIEQISYIQGFDVLIQLMRIIRMKARLSTVSGRAIDLI
jgi:hypothetical protein